MTDSEAPMNKTVEVSQGARDAAADYANDHWLWPAPHVEDLRRGGPEWDGYHLTQAFARFEASLRTTPSTDAVREAVGRDALQRIVCLRPAGDVERCTGARRLVAQMESIALAALEGMKS